MVSFILPPAMVIISYHKTALVLMLLSAPLLCEFAVVADCHVHVRSGSLELG